MSEIFHEYFTTELNIKSFLLQTFKFPENDPEISKEFNKETDLFEFSRNYNIENLNHCLPLKEDENKEKYFYNSNTPLDSEKNKIFKIIYRNRLDTVKDIKNAPFNNGKKDLKNNHCSKRKRRRENVDNILKKIKTSFFNIFLFNKINKELKSKQSRMYFEKFPIIFVNDVKRNTNKEIINISLLEIISNKDLYNQKDLNNYYHNLNVVENKETQENEGLKEILNKKYSELFEEYINSNEFNVDEINRLKNKNMDNAYIKKYKYQSKHFIEYFTE